MDRAGMSDKVYIVIEDYSHGDFSKRTILGVFDTMKKAVSYRNKKAKKEAIEYDEPIKISDDPNAKIEILGSTYFIIAAEVK